MQIHRVLITGTTSGVGRGLLDHYVRTGVKVIAVNRRRVAELESLYPTVRFACLDVRSAGDVAELLRELAATNELPEVFILNAGINRLDNAEAFDLSLYREVIETNLYGVLNFVAFLTTVPVQPARRHIVAISSLVTIAGNSYALGYRTSKQALTAAFDAWADMYTGTDLVFKQVMLGPVATAIVTMNDRLPRWVVAVKGLASASMGSTVRAIARFAGNRRRKLIHPWRAVPAFLALRLVRWLLPGVFKGRRTASGAQRRRRAV